MYGRDNIKQGKVAYFYCGLLKVNEETKSKVRGRITKCVLCQRSTPLELLELSPAYIDENLSLKN